MGKDQQERERQRREREQTPMPPQTPPEQPDADQQPPTEPLPGQPPPLTEEEGDDKDGGSTEARTSKPQAKMYSQREFTTELRKQAADLEQQIRAKVLADLDLEKAKASGELSKVIEAQEKRIRELEGLEPEVQTFRTLSEQRYQTAFAKLPDSIKMFAPADDAPMVEKERWLIEKALPAAEKLGASDPVKGLSKSGDPPEKSKSKDDFLKDIRAGYSLTGEYRPM